MFFVTKFVIQFYLSSEIWRLGYPANPGETYRMFYTEHPPLNTITDYVLMNMLLAAPYSCITLENFQFPRFQPLTKLLCGVRPGQPSLYFISLPPSLSYLDRRLSFSNSLTVLYRLQIQVLPFLTSSPALQLISDYHHINMINSVTLLQTETCAFSFVLALLFTLSKTWLKLLSLRYLNFIYPFRFHENWSCLEAHLRVPFPCLRTESVCCTCLFFNLVRICVCWPHCLLLKSEQGGDWRSTTRRLRLVCFSRSPNNFERPWHLFEKIPIFYDT